MRAEHTDTTLTGLSSLYCQFPPQMRCTVKQVDRKFVLKKPCSGLEARWSCADNGDALDGIMELEGGVGFGLSFRRAEPI
jgi:hypothetical protein